MRNQDQMSFAAILAKHCSGRDNGLFPRSL